MPMDIYKWIVILVGMTVLFNLAGLPTGAGLILDFAGINLQDNPENFNLGNLVLIVGAVFAAVGLGGLAIGIATKQNPIPFILAASFMGLLVSFVGDTIVIITYTFGNFADWVGWITLLILLPLNIGYIFSLVDWWKS